MYQENMEYLLIVDGIMENLVGSNQDKIISSNTSVLQVLQNYLVCCSWIAQLRLRIKLLEINKENI